jgi:hypothetical protein
LIKTLCAVVFFLGALNACNHTDTQPKPSPVPNSKDAIRRVIQANVPGAPCPPNEICQEIRPAIARLAQVAKERHLYWYVRPTAWSGEWAVVARAWQGDALEPVATFIEDGGKPNWYAFGSSQEEAVTNLLKRLQSAPNDVPAHRSAMINGGPDGKWSTQ